MVAVALILTLVVPQFRTRTHADLKRSALKLAAMIEHAFQQSAFRQETLRLHFDLENSRYWLDRFVDPGMATLRAPAGAADSDLEGGEDAEEDDAEEAHYVMDRKILPEPVELPEGVFIISVTTQYIEETTEGEAFTHFFPDGYAEPAVIYIADDLKAEYTLIVTPLSGKVKVFQGHHEFEVDMKEERT
jgi:hypothetical protein